MIEQLMSSPLAWIILSGCTVLSFLFGIIIWIFGRKKKSITFMMKSYPIIQRGESTIPDLAVQYKNESIEDLSITRYAIWNNGNEIINHDDVVTSRLLTVKSKSEKTKILNAEIIEMSDSSNQFGVKLQEDNQMTVTFDYLEPKEGAILQILHNGSPSDLVIDCKIKGGQFKSEKTKKKDKNRKHTRIIYIILMGIEFVLLSVMSCQELLVIWGVLPIKGHRDISMDPNMRMVFTILLIVFSILGWLFYFKMIKHTYYMQIPGKLRKKFEYE